MSKNLDKEKKIQRYCNRLREIKEIARSVFQLPNNINIDELKSIIFDISKSWSQSNAGYHARVYYNELETPPPNALFNSMCGLTDIGFYVSVGDWRLYDYDGILDLIFEESGINKDCIIEIGKEFSENFENLKENSLTQIEILKLVIGDCDIIKKIRNQISKLQCLSLVEIRKLFIPSGQFITRDPNFDGKFYIAPHQEADAIRLYATNPIQNAKELANIIERLIDFVESTLNELPAVSLGSKIFIGHGHSLLWREIKDFIQDRLKLSWDEFNSIPQAGFSVKERLEEMLENAAFALLIHTAEDEIKSQKFFARQNVVHETGLFQGKLGFNRAIIIREEGCEEFSNVHGLTQIQFPKGNISAIFEEIRKVLEREGIL